MTATGGDCRAGGADGAAADGSPAANAAAAMAGLVDGPGRGAAGGRVAPVGLAAAIGGRAALSGERGLPPGAGRSSRECSGQADFWPLLLVIALVPAVCEELAFRGFILSGFRHLGHKWRAIVLSALLVRADARHPAAIADRLAGRGADRIPGRAERQHSARHGVPSGPQHAGGGRRPDHAGDASRNRRCCGRWSLPPKRADACSLGRWSSPAPRSDCCC